MAEDKHTQPQSQQPSQQPSRLQSQYEHDDELNYALSDDSLAALKSRLSGGEQSVEVSERHADSEASIRTERLLRETPKVAPSAGFADRVMAAIAALPLPDYVRRELSVGLALGLLAAAVLTVPLLALAFVALVSTLAQPSAWSGILGYAIDAANYVGGMLLHVGDEVQSLVSGTPVVPALLGIMIPLLAVWGWVLWQFLGKGRVSLRR